MIIGNLVWKGGKTSGYENIKGHEGGEVVRWWWGGKVNIKKQGWMQCDAMKTSLLCRKCYEVDWYGANRDWKQVYNFFMK